MMGFKRKPYFPCTILTTVHSSMENVLFQGNLNPVDRNKSLIWVNEKLST